MADLASALPRSRGASAWASVLLAGWLLALVGGLGVLTRYSGTPGREASPPQRWPVESRLERTSGRSTLVMLAHPSCPCTRASLGELARILARVGDVVTTHVVFTGVDAADADLRPAAEALPGVAVDLDPGGDEARRFGAFTSGEVILYSPDGAVIFHGGITPARGHEGDSEGERAIIDSLLRRANDTSVAPVFGCPFGPPPPGSPG